MSKKVSVSSNFNKFMSKNASAVKEAREAENTMATCSMPVGWEGHCVCTGAVADKGKDRKDDKGNTQEGREYVRLEFDVINDEKYAGSSFSKVWSFYDTEKATAMDRFGWCMNALENMGLPAEMRRSEDTTLEEILDYFASGDTVFSCSVKHTEYARDNKEVTVTLTEAVDETDSVMPGSSSLEVGSNVKYMGKEWEVVDIDGNDVSIKSPTTGNTKTITTDDLD